MRLLAATALLIASASPVAAERMCVEQAGDVCLKYQPVGTVNFPNTEAYTRITEFKSLTGQQHSGTSIVEEYPKAYGAPYYPIPRPENEQKYQAYKNLARQEEHVTFVGRLAEYRYRNMDQVVATALKKAKQLSQQLIAA